MKRVILIILLIGFSFHLFAYISAIAIQTEKNSSMQVYVNGKLFNKQPEKFVRINSMPGLFHIELKVLNPFDKEWYIVRKDVRIQKGYEYFYKVEFTEGKRPTLKEIRRFPVYSKYFWNPTLYYKHPTS